VAELDIHAGRDVVWISWCDIYKRSGFPKFLTTHKDGYWGICSSTGL